MKRWVVINTAGQGYTQKYAPPLTFFKKKTDAIKYLRARIKEYLEEDEKAKGHYGTIKTFIQWNGYQGNFPIQFETNEGEFFLEQVEFE